MTAITLNKVVFVMGVSGSGKSTIGQLLANDLGLPFIDADDHHPAANIEKMSKGVPLTDEDRRPWLRAVNKLARQHIKSGCVIACSALKHEYRTALNDFLESTEWVYLRGTFDQIFQRLERREDHFMGAEMLRSQFDVLQEPSNAMVVDIDASPQTIAEEIKRHLQL